jgi:hypothetical protein
MASATPWTAAEGENWLVMFICNHCPFVKAIIDRLIRDCRELAEHGIGCVAIMSNDVAAYPTTRQPTCSAGPRNWPSLPLSPRRDAGGGQSLRRRARRLLRLQRPTATPVPGPARCIGPRSGPADARRELFEAMTMIARTGQGPREQQASIGCSIKWHI